jgi:hypothetical protein
MTQKEKDYIESLIDKYDLYNVLVAISEICREKEDHILSNWQDKNLAKRWAKNAGLIDKVNIKLVPTH